MFSYKRFLLLGISLSMITWGISWPSAKVITHYAQPLQIAFLRFIITFLTVFLLLLLLKTKFAISKKGLRDLGFSAILLSGYSILFFTGLQKGSPGAGGVLVTTTTPIVSYFLAMIILKRKPSKKEFLGLGIGIIGGMFLLSLWKNFNNIFALGNSYFLLSTLTWAILSRFTAKSANYGSPLAFSMWMYLLCALILFFFVDAKSILNVVENGDKIFWFNLIFNGAVNAGLATTFFFLATSKLGAERTSSFIYIVPFSAALFSNIFLNEKIYWNTIIGGTLGICAVIIINIKKENYKKLFSIFSRNNI